MKPAAKASAKKSAKKSVRHEKVGAVTSASVEKGTGRGWDEWLSLLDEAGARGWTHQETVAHLGRKYRLTEWWRQGVTGGYEVMTGKRVAGRNLKGEYSITITKSMPVSDKTLWALLASPEGLAVWLKPLGEFRLQAKRAFETEDGAFGEVRTMVAGRRARLSWRESDEGKPSIVLLNLVHRPGAKSLLVFTHEGLVDGRRREPLRARWRAAADALHERVSGSK